MIFQMIRYQATAALFCCGAGEEEVQGGACPTRVGQAERRIVWGLPTHCRACPTRVGQEGRCVACYLMLGGKVAEVRCFMRRN